MSPFVEALLLGLVQGLTEFLPVSSSGHLALFQALLGWKDPASNLAFNIAVHLGSLAAVLLFVRRELWSMVTTAPRLMLVLATATLPVAVLGLLLKDAVESISSNVAAVGGLLMVTAAILWFASRARDGSHRAPTMPLSRALAVGFAQVLAILPGVSRSGATLAASLRVGLEREQAVRFAFLMAVPAIGGAGLLLLRDGLPRQADGMQMIAGGAVSFLASLLAMRVMVGVVVRKRLFGFALYCAGAGLVAIVAGR